MIKKIMILFLIGIIAFGLFVGTTYGINQNRERLTNDIVWDRINNNGVYHVQSNLIPINFNDIEMEFDTNMGDWHGFIVANSNGFSSRVEIHEEEYSSATPISTYTIAYEAPEATSLLFLFDDLGNSKVDIENYQNMFLKIILMVDPNATQSLIANIAFWLNSYPEEYSFNIYAFYDIVFDLSIADLPITSGNPMTPGETGTGHEWIYNYTETNFSITIRYFQDYILSIPDIHFDNPTFLENVETIDYYTIEGDRFLQFNYYDNDNVLLTESGHFAKSWNTFTTWNLTTNEVVQFHRALALTYIEVRDNREMYAYLYLPNIPMDDLIAVSGNFQYRYGYTNLFGTQKYHDWETAIFHLERDITTQGTTSVFEGGIPQWSYNMLLFSGGTIAAGAIIAMVPGLQGVGFKLLAVGAVSAIGSVGAGNIQMAISGNISELETLTPEDELKTRLNNHYRLAVTDFEGMENNAEVHRLFLGLFSKMNTNVVHPDPNRLVYTEITWLTNGQAYTLDEKLIDTQAVLDVSFEADLPTEDEGDLDLLTEIETILAVGNMKMYLIIAVGVLFLMILPKIQRSFKNVQKGFKLLFTPFGIITVIIIIGIILYLTGNL